MANEEITPTPTAPTGTPAAGATPAAGQPASPPTAPDTDGDAGGADESWTPPSRQDWDNVNLALKKARQDARQAKRAGTSAASGDEGSPDAAKAVADATAAAEAKYKPLVVKAAARAAFVEAGLVLQTGKADTAMARAIRLLDLDDIDLTDDGAAEGLAEQVAEIKADFPELFAAKPVRSGARVDGADKGAGGNGKPKSSADRIAALINGG